MKKLILSIVSCLGLSMILPGCSPVTDYEIYGSIKGTVVDYDTGMAIAGANIMIVPGNQTVMSDVNGSFEFLDLDSGQYTLSIQKSGYQANRKIVDVITGETVNTAISLSVIPSE